MESEIDQRLDADVVASPTTQAGGTGPVMCSQVVPHGGPQAVPGVIGVYGGRHRVGERDRLARRRPGGHVERQPFSVQRRFEPLGAEPAEPLFGELAVVVHR